MKYPTYRTRETGRGHSHYTMPYLWNVEVRYAPKTPWRAIGHVRRIMWEHYIPSYGGECLGSTETRRESIEMIKAKDAHPEVTHG